MPDMKLEGGNSQIKEQCLHPVGAYNLVLKK